MPVNCMSNEAPASSIDREVRQLLAERHETATDLPRGGRSELDLMVETLLQSESVRQIELVNLLSSRPDCLSPLSSDPGDLQSIPNRQAQLLSQYGIISRTKGIQLNFKFSFYELSNESACKPPPRAHSENASLSYCTPHSLLFRQAALTCCHCRRRC